MFRIKRLGMRGLFLGFLMSGVLALTANATEPVQCNFLLLIGPNGERVCYQMACNPCSYICCDCVCA
jgi:hypothetical protein